MRRCGGQIRTTDQKFITSIRLKWLFRCTSDCGQKFKGNQNRMQQFGGPMIFKLIGSLWLSMQCMTCTNARTLQMFTFHRHFFLSSNHVLSVCLRFHAKKVGLKTKVVKWDRTRYQNQLASIDFSDSYHENICIAVIVFIEYVKLPILSLDSHIVRQVE